MTSVSRGRLALATAVVGGSAVAFVLTACSAAPSTRVYTESQATTQTEPAPRGTAALFEDAATASPLPSDDLEARVAAIHASETAAARATTARPSHPTAGQTATGRIPKSSIPKTRSTPRYTAKPTSTTFKGTGYILEHLTDDRTNFQNAYHNGDECSDGFHYKVDIYNAAEDFVKSGSMQLGVVSNLHKHSGYVEFRCTYPFTFKLSKSSAAYIFHVHEMPYMTQRDFGTKVVSTSALQSGRGPTFHGIDD